MLHDTQHVAKAHWPSTNNYSDKKAPHLIGQNQIFTQRVAMERTYTQILHQYLLRLSPPPLTTNLRHRRSHNVQNQAQFSMPLTDLTLRRITTATPPFKFRFNHHHHTNPFSLNNNIISIDPKTMSDQPKRTGIQPQSSDATPTTNLSKSGDHEEQKESEKSTPPIPPPPEKPLPGDCCGSGCVRCVWDVYYDELEEYNKLYKAK